MIRILVGRGTIGVVLVSSLMAAILFSNARPVGAKGQPDQFQLIGDSPIGVASTPLVWAQTFTPAISGVLDTLTLRVERIEGGDGGDLIVAIGATADGVPSGHTLAMTVVTRDKVPAQGTSLDLPPLDVTFATPATVSAGTIYAIVLLSTAPPPGQAASFAALAALQQPQPVYTRGQLLDIPTGSHTWALVPGALVFTTYVTPGEQTSYGTLLRCRAPMPSQVLPPGQVCA